jgi:hypothetical protein
VRSSDAEAAVQRELLQGSRPFGEHGHEERHGRDEVPKVNFRAEALVNHPPHTYPNHHLLHL